MSGPYTTQIIPDQSVAAGVHYRISDAQDNRIATCYDPKNASDLTAMLTRCSISAANIEQPAQADKSDLLAAAKRLEKRGFFAPSSCADRETAVDMAAMRAAMRAAIAKDRAQEVIGEAEPHAPQSAAAQPVSGAVDELPPLPEAKLYDTPAGLMPRYTAHQMQAYARAAIELSRAQQAPAQFDMAAHLQRQAQWSEATFGPGSRAAGVVDHIRKELIEIEADPGDLKEWIDVVILALDGAWRSGASPQEIIEALVAKQLKNEGRIWPDWQTADPNKAIEHDRSRDEPAAALVSEQTTQDEFLRGVIAASREV